MSLSVKIAPGMAALAVVAGKVEIVFDGKLADVSDTLAIDIGADYRVKKIIEVDNGIVKP